jgi:hypothetical protein
MKRPINRLSSTVIRMPDGQGLLVVEHRAEMAHVKPAFKEVKLNRGGPMAMALVWRPLSFA